MYILVAILLLIVIIFGVSSGMQSYATAQQAQATIEVAQLGQINAWGNLVTILTVVLAFVVFVALVAAVLWMMYKRSSQRSVVSHQRLAASDQPRVAAPTPAPSLETLIQLETLRMLRSMNPPASLPSGNGDGPHDLLSKSDDEPLQWLR